LYNTRRDHSNTLSHYSAGLVVHIYCGLYSLYIEGRECRRSFVIIVEESVMSWYGISCPYKTSPCLGHSNFLRLISLEFLPRLSPRRNANIATNAILPTSLTLLSLSFIIRAVSHIACSYPLQSIYMYK